MTRVRGLPNQDYAERKEAFSRIIKAVYDGYATDPLPPEWLDALDRRK
jgi:hypothetical protein